MEDSAAGTLDRAAAPGAGVTGWPRCCSLAWPRGGRCCVRDRARAAAPAPAAGVPSRRRPTAACRAWAPVPAVAIDGRAGAAASVLLALAAASAVAAAGRACVGVGPVVVARRRPSPAAVIDLLAGPRCRAARRVPSHVRRSPSAAGAAELPGRSPRRPAARRPTRRRPRAGRAREGVGLLADLAVAWRVVEPTGARLAGPAAGWPAAARADEAVRREVAAQLAGPRATAAAARRAAAGRRAARHRAGRRPGRLPARVGRPGRHLPAGRVGAGRGRARRGPRRSRLGPSRRRDRGPGSVLLAALAGLLAPAPRGAALGRLHRAGPVVDEVQPAGRPVAPVPRHLPRLGAGSRSVPH